MQSNVATKIIAQVDMVSSHIPMSPINKKLKSVPETIKIDREANQHIDKIVNIVIGQGVFKNNFSNPTKKLKSGSKKVSIPSP